MLGSYSITNSIYILYSIILYKLQRIAPQDTDKLLDIILHTFYLRSSES